MFQGTGSDAGKSLIVAGLCRAFARRGMKVRPFKPQNMSNNAAVTEDGGEIGRAQALQARACGVAPGVHMNPVLLKPQSETGAQVVVRGKMRGSADARAYTKLKPTLMPAVLDSFARLRAEADLVLVEGAGSPAEVNLRQGDIANMGFATAAGVNVVLIGDIDRGGVIAAIAGTHALLPPEERALLKGYIVNKFCGDARLFDPAPAIIKQHTGLDCLGIVKWFADALESLSPEKSDALVRVAVPRLPRIANFDDLDPLRAEPDVGVEIVPPGMPLPVCDLVLLPGSKATIADLKALGHEGWDIDIKAHVRRGGRVLGLCAGYQMLGKRVADPQGIEGRPGETEGLGLLDVETVLTGGKTLRAVVGTDRNTGQAVNGYEMHAGVTSGPGAARAMLDLGGRPDGAVSPDGRVMGCYVHGIFARDEFRAAFLKSLRAERKDHGIDYEATVEATLDSLSDHLAAAIDLDRLLAIAR